MRVAGIESVSLTMGATSLDGSTHTRLSTHSGGMPCRPFRTLLTRVTGADSIRTQVAYVQDLRLDLEFREMTRDLTWTWRSLT